MEIRLKGEMKALLTPGAIFVSNHTSYFDVVVLTSLLPAPIHFVAKQELADQWLIGHLLRALGTCFVERGKFSSSIADEQELVQRAGRGERLLYFPEGSFTRAAGLRAFHLGAFRAACIARRSIVPLALDGTRSALPDGDWIPQRALITVTACTPIEPEGADLAAMADLRDKVRACILAHCGEGDSARLGYVSTAAITSTQSAAENA
jgi:1-acyl-sn-glycerol-3-phosphate acyltransferase